MLRIHFYLRVSDNELLGDQYEYNSRVEVSGSWGEYHMAKGISLPLENAGPPAIFECTLPKRGEWRGDENVWFEQVVKTCSSGHLSFDAKEQGYAERDLPAGMGHVSLVTLVQAAKNSSLIELTLIDTMLFRWIKKEKDALEKSTKGTLILQVETVSGSLPSVQEMQPSVGVLLYDTEAQRQAMKKMEKRLSSAFAQQWGDANGTKGMYGTTDNDDFNDGFIWYRWITYQGSLPPYAYAMHEASQRLSLRVQKKSSYKRTMKQAQFFERLAHSAVESLGLTPAQVLAAIDRQVTQSHSDDRIHPEFYLALEVINLLASGTANCLYYTKDMRFPSRRTVVAEHGGKVPPSPSVAERQAFATDHPDKEGLNELYISIEDFNSSPVWGTVLTADCEDMALLALAVIMALMELARDVDRSALATTCPLIHSILRVLSFYEPQLVHGSVTSAFVNTDGNVLGREDMMAMKVLPNVHSPEFTKQRKGGHMWAELDPERAGLESLVLLEAGKRLPPAMEKRLQELQTTAWQKHLPKLVFEGTTPNETWVLGLGEIVAAAGGRPDAVEWHQKRIAAQHQFLSKTVGKSIPALLSIAHFECPSYYSGPPTDPDSSVSNFYRYATQLVRPTWVEKYGPKFGTLTPIMVTGTKGSFTRGVEMGQWLRSALYPDRRGTVVGITPTFGLIQEQEWEEIVVPVTECLLNQMPLSALGRRGDMNCLLMDQCHPLDDHLLCLMSDLPRKERTEGLRKHAVGWTRAMFESGQPPLTGNFPQTIGGSGGAEPNSVDRETTTLRFYFEPYMIQDRQQTEQLLSQLKKARTDGILSRHRVKRDRPLVGGRNRVTLTLYFKV